MTADEFVEQYKGYKVRDKEGRIGVVIDTVSSDFVRVKTDDAHYWYRPERLEVIDNKPLPLPG